jgi:hypothetical protein
MHTYINTHTYTHTLHTHTHIHTYIHTYNQGSKGRSASCSVPFSCTCIHTYIHTYTHTYTHTYIHTHIHTHTHTHINTIRVQKAVVQAAVSLSPDDKPLKDSGIALFRPAVNYKGMEWLLVDQGVLKFNQTRGLWQCDVLSFNMIRCPPGWLLDDSESLRKVCMHTYIHTYIHIYIHTYIHVSWMVAIRL